MSESRRCDRRGERVEQSCLTTRSRHGGSPRRSRILSAALGFLAAFAVPSLALAQVTHHPISAKLLKVKSTQNGVEAVFVSNDPARPFPAIGSVDDPRLRTSDIYFEVYSAAQGVVRITAPNFPGNPNWKVETTGPDSYDYRSPVPSVFDIGHAKLVEGRRLRIRTLLNFPVGARLGTVAVRVRTGSLWSCALFDAASIGRDDGRFRAMNAPAPAFADCEDATLQAAIMPGCSSASSPSCDATCPDGGLCVPDDIGGSCRCVNLTQPCGATEPICGGECGPGERCYPIDDFIPGSINGCACAPVGSPPCGASGQTCEAGRCPEGLECGVVPAITPIYESSCGCIDPSATCGPGFGTCPPDLQCTFFPPGAGGSWSCLPTFCGGSYPICGGSCGGGRSCVPLDLHGSGFCVCATPSLSCDDLACGEGLFCPSGEVCTVASAGGTQECSCEPL
jgi:hypothetical protein